METSYEEILQGWVWFALNARALKAIRAIERAPEMFCYEAEMEILTSNLYKMHLLRYS